MKNNNKKFLVDFMLGSLARRLRVFGYDTVYADKAEGINLVLNSLKENRILITRNQSLSSKRAWKLVLIRSDKCNEQLKQLVKELGISVSKEKLFLRCSICNTLVEQVEKDSVKDLVPEYTFQTHTEFSKCPKCNKVYWTGTHLELLIKDLKKAGIEVK